jgi:hypothetical protein
MQATMYDRDVRHRERSEGERKRAPVDGNMHSGFARSVRDSLAVRFKFNGNTAGEVSTSESSPVRHQYSIGCVH